MTETTVSRLRGEALTLGYGDRVVAEGLDLDLPDGGFTALIGPNACGKSTALRALVRLLRPLAGRVVLDGRDIARTAPKTLARQVALLSQGSTAPDGITVYQLVSRGRFPHQGMLRQWSGDDERAVARALELCGLTNLAERSVTALSGGQRQRAWIALALAQETDLLLLDEPTTYLDLGHQIEVLDLCRGFNRDGTTVVAVLHDVNQAARYADHLIVMAAGRVIASGSPEVVLTPELIQAAYGVECVVVPDPVTGTPMIVARGPAGPQGPPAIDG